MRQAIPKQPFSDTFSAYLLEQLAIPAERVRSTSRDPVGEHLVEKMMPRPHGD
jgi:hypothetical protein